MGFFDTNYDEVIKYLKSWRSVGCSTEKDFENSLYNGLHKKFPDLQVTKQHAKGRIRADLMIGEDILIEIKKNLDTTAKYQRLLGQIAEYKSWNGKIILLLLGKTDQNLLKQLNKYLENEGLAGYLSFIGKVTVFKK